MAYGDPDNIPLIILLGYITAKYQRKRTLLASDHNINIIENG
jgi:hypothetical protein